MVETSFEVVDGKYRLIKVIGEGYSGSVYLAEDIDKGTNVALKIFQIYSYNKKALSEKFLKESTIMEGLIHDNIAKLLDFNMNGKRTNEHNYSKDIMYLAMEYYSRGEIFDYIYKQQKGFSESIARYFFRQLIEGVVYLHSPEVDTSHRDLKPDNLVLDSDFTLKICDFGFASNKSKVFTTTLGTVGYQAPEILENKEYSGESVDVFSCGVILFILVNGYPPFKEAKKNDFYYKNIYFDDSKEFWLKHKKINNSEAFKELINGMLSYKSRIGLKEIAESVWYKEEIASIEEVNLVLANPEI